MILRFNVNKINHNKNKMILPSHFYSGGESEGKIYEPFRQKNPAGQRWLGLCSPVQATTGIFLKIVIGKLARYKIFGFNKINNKINE